MKKIAILTFALFVALVVFGALEFSGARAIPVHTSSTTVNSGATNTTYLTLGSLKGGSEVILIANGNASRTALNVSLYATNAVSGGWTYFQGESFSATNAGVYRVRFPGAYLSKDAKLEVNSVGAATAFTSFILTY